MPDSFLTLIGMSHSKINMSGCPIQDSTERLYLSLHTVTCKGQASNTAPYMLHCGELLGVNESGIWGANFTILGH